MLSENKVMVRNLLIWIYRVWVVIGCFGVYVWSNAHVIKNRLLVYMLQFYVTIIVGVPYK